MSEKFDYKEEQLNYYSKRIPTFYSTNLSLQNCKKLTTYGFYWNSTIMKVVCHSCNLSFDEKLGVKTIM